MPTHSSSSGCQIGKVPTMQEEVARFQGRQDTRLVSRLDKAGPGSMCNRNVKSESTLIVSESRWGWATSGQGGASTAKKSRPSGLSPFPLVPVSHRSRGRVGGGQPVQTGVAHVCRPCVGWGAVIVCV